MVTRTTVPRPGEATIRGPWLRRRGGVSLVAMTRLISCSAGLRGGRRLARATPLAQRPG